MRSEKKFQTSSRIYALDTHGENERIKDITRRRFGQDFILELLKYDSPIVLSIKESEYFDNEQFAFRDVDFMDKEFSISANVVPVEYKTVIVEVPKYISVKAPFLRRLKWMVTGE